MAQWLGFIQNPQNSGVIFLLAMVLLIFSLIGRRVRKRQLMIKGNNSGIVVNGNVKGNIKQEQTATAESDNTPHIGWLSLLSALSGIGSFLLAAIAFYLQFMQP